MVDASVSCIVASLDDIALKSEIEGQEKELEQTQTRLSQIRAETNELEEAQTRISDRLAFLRLELDKRVKDEQVDAKESQSQVTAEPKLVATSIPTVPLLPVSKRGLSCTKTILEGLKDIEFQPSLIHIVGASEAELSMDFSSLAQGLAPGAEVVLVGPHIFRDTRHISLNEAIIGPELHVSGLRISAFPQTYQRYLAQHPSAPNPEFVVLFHPGLDVHYFAWYPCLRHWAENKIPVLVTAYTVPGGHGEKPETVKTLLETLVGTGGGVGMWVMNDENEHTIEDGSFNSAYYVFRGSHGNLPLHPESMYFALFEALLKIKHPFAPRVGYLDVDSEDGRVNLENPKLLASIAEGAIRGAMYGDDGTDRKTADSFAAKVLEDVLGSRAAQIWRTSKHERTSCANCGEGYDSEAWHQAICPAVGMSPLAKGETATLANLKTEKLDGKKGTLQEFNRLKHRWAVILDGKPNAMLFKAVNLKK